MTALSSALALVAAALAPTAPPCAPREVPLAVTAFDGTRLAGTLALPSGRGPHPAALIVSGLGPNGRDGLIGGVDGFPYRGYARGLACRGVATLRYDKRGVGSSGGEPAAWLDVRLMIADARAAGRSLARRRDVDRRRLALVGHSQGGDVALVAALRLPSVRRVVLASTPARPLPEIDRGGAFLLRALGRNGPGVRATLALRPLPAAVSLRVPLLIAHGDADAVVPFGDSLRLLRARRAAGRPTRLVRVPRGDHLLRVDGRPATSWLDAGARFLRGR